MSTKTAEEPKPSAEQSKAGHDALLEGGAGGGMPVMS